MLWTELRVRSQTMHSIWPVEQQRFRFKYIGSWLEWLGDIFSDFPQLLLTNTGIIHSNKLQQLLYTCIFNICDHLTIISCPACPILLEVISLTTSGYEASFEALAALMFHVEVFWVVMPFSFMLSVTTQNKSAWSGCGAHYVSYLAS